MTTEIDGQPVPSSTASDQAIPGGLRVLFLMKAIAAVVVGLPLLFVPETWASVVRWGSIDPTMARFFAVAVFSTGIAGWLSYRERQWESVRVVHVMEMVGSVLLALAALYAVAVADGPVFAWLVVILGTVLGGSFSYYYRLMAGAVSTTSDEASGDWS